MQGGILPKPKDKLPCGSPVGTWLKKQQNMLKKRKLNKTEIRDLDDVAPGWRGETPESPEILPELDSKDIFLANMAQAEEFVAARGRWPRDAERKSVECRLARWLTDQQALDSVGRLPIERAERLDQKLLGWQQAVADELERQWQASLAKLVAFVDASGDLPTGQPAQWMYDQRRSLVQRTLSRYHMKALDKAVVGWHGCIKMPRKPTKPTRGGEQD